MLTIIKGFTQVYPVRRRNISRSLKQPRPAWVVQVLFQSGRTHQAWHFGAPVKLSEERAN